MHVYRSLQKKGQPLCLTNSVTHYPVVHRGYPAKLIDDALKTGDMGGKDRLPQCTQQRIDWWKANSKRFQASGKRASVRRGRLLHSYGGVCPLRRNDYISERRPSIEVRADRYSGRTTAQKWFALCQAGSCCPIMTHTSMRGSCSICRRLGFTVGLSSKSSFT